METSIKEKVVAQTIYITEDGEEFDDEDYAKIHDVELWYDKKFNDSNKHEYEDDCYYVVNSLDEFEKLKYYIVESVGECFDFDLGDKPDKLQFPLIIKHDPYEGNIHVISKDDYEHFKVVCQMYEVINNN